jgi:multidrug efflux pump subunit AcrA (membrane-fusion protein)
MRIPSNIPRPSSGDVLSVIRPGFPNDVRKARVVGVGASLDVSGSYMADAVLTDPTEWPIGSSVRVLVPLDSDSPVVKMSAVMWDENGLPAVWAISTADRIYLKKLKVGRTIGDFIEVYDGMEKGDRYIANPTLEIREDMFLSDIIRKVEGNTVPSAESGKTGHEGHGNMEGM